ncbi:serine/threonine-protein kinase [Streptosporangium saharense]|uniref:Serine/threonine protein kinase n=1 Tax=Streptosporangium saharense TaxID=1706840 RepID=A0A7W7VQW8_9ACTN|nr:serine/threonine-protein kinase [Streptosporangium saharense]MBB4918705.1 serine/threonine protein kinase [Streptosporangium saharense]
MNQDDRLGPYRLLRRLGEGGMGVVHLAVDPQGRQVAVKVLRSEVAGDDVARRRLSREVETMRRVRTEHIAEVLDADVTGHRPYIVTRYVPGQPLDDHVKQEGPMDLPALLKVAYGVASALASVHSVGVIHRDLKPGNVLILDGRPVLIDFGIAQAVDATRLTQTGMFIGTPGYLAPEIIEGHEAGPEVDVHAWAGTMVFAATGQPPFGKGTLEMIFYNITAGRANVDAVPEALRPVLRAALQRDPARRPRAAELAAQIERLMASSPGRPSPPDDVPTVTGFEGRSTDLGQPTGPYVPTGLGATPGVPRATDPGQATGAYVPTGLGPRPGPVIDPGPPTGPYVPTGLGPRPGERRTGERTDPGDVPTPVASRPGTSKPWPPNPTPNPAPPPPDYVSLLGEQQQGGDPWPTRRVTPEELRQATAQSAPQQAFHEQPGGLSPGGDGDIPTQRVRPHELEQLRNQMQRQHPQGQASFERAPQPGRHHTPQTAATPQQPYQATRMQPYPEERQEWRPAAPSPAPRSSAVYGVAGALLLVAVTAAAVIAPVLVAVVVIPAVVLLRAADIAQPALNGRRQASEGAADVLRVLGQPAALAKSAGITLALVPYGLVLGLPVTLLLTVLVRTLSPAAALSWGAAVALWTICAGPGVEGPRRQMRRTLASLLPSRGAAVAVTFVLGAVAVLALLLAVGTFRGGVSRAHWAPLDVGTVVGELRNLRDRATR